MNNRIRQDSLDAETYLENVKTGQNMYGKMPWCKFCPNVIDGRCFIQQGSRDETTECARAWNKMKRHESKGQ